MQLTAVCVHIIWSIWDRDAWWTSTTRWRTVRQACQVAGGECSPGWWSAVPGGTRPPPRSRRARRTGASGGRAICRRLPELRPRPRDTEQPGGPSGSLQQWKERIRSRTASEIGMIRHFFLFIDNFTKPRVQREGAAKFDALVRFRIQTSLRKPKQKQVWCFKKQHLFDIKNIGAHLWHRSAPSSSIYPGRSCPSQLHWT